jgi:hypothetical protein
MEMQITIYHQISNCYAGIATQSLKTMAEKTNARQENTDMEPKEELESSSPVYRTGIIPIYYIGILEIGAACR